MKTNMKLLVAAAFILGAGGIAFSQFYTQGANAEDAAAKAQSASAQPSLGNLETAWAQRCNSEEGAKSGSKRGKCEMFQRQDVKESGQRVIEFAIGYPEGQEDARGIFILPMGILLQSGVKLSVDDNPPMSFQVRYCMPNGCYAFVSLNESTLAKFSKGQNAIVEVVNAEGKIVKIPMPLKGFTKALQDIKG